MIAKPVSDIGLDDVKLLVDSSRLEDQFIEYKRDFPGPGEDRTPLVKTACAFANTGGGDILVGVEAANGVPVATPGVESKNPDATVLSLKAQIRDGIEPPLSGLQIKVIPAGGSRSIFLVRVERSWSRPHRVKRGNDFYARGAGGNFTLDLDSVRREMRSQGALRDQARYFQSERISAVLNGETPVDLRQASVLLIHTCPISSLVDDEWIIHPHTWDESRPHFAPPMHYATSSGYDFHADGYVVVAGSRSRPLAYSLLFRSGRVEMAYVLQDSDGGKLVHALSVEKSISDGLRASVGALSHVGLDPPCMAAVSLVGVRGVRFDSGSRWEEQERNLSRDVLALPWMLVPDRAAQLNALLRPSIEAIWHSVGLPKVWRE